MSRLKNKNILVTGASGMVGIQLVNILLEKGALVTGVSIDSIDGIPNMFSQPVNFINGDLRNFDFCMEIARDRDIVFHVAGIKGSPQVALGRPSTFFVNTSQFNLNVIEACRRNAVSEFLYTSSIGVYAPAELFREDDVWKTFPSENDRYAGWAKRMGELQIEAAKKQYGWNDTYIVRPANIYGPWDNFDPENAMVVPSLIARIFNGENPLRVWGDGSSIRDFVHAKDVARAMVHVVEQKINIPVNVGSGFGISISDLANTISDAFGGIKIEWDTSKPSGERVRIMDTQRIISTGFRNEISLEKGIMETIEWYRKNNKFSGRYNAFKEEL